MSSFQILLKAGQSLLNKQDWHNSLLIFNKILSLPEISSKDKASAYYSRSIINSNLLSFEEAKTDVLASIDLSRTFVPGYQQASTVFLSMNNHYEAMKILRLGYSRLASNELRQQFIELYYKYHLKSKVLSTNRYFSQLEKFKGLFLQDYEEAVKFNHEVEENRGNCEEYLDLENVVAEMREILYENFSFERMAVYLQDKRDFHSANLCWKALYDSEFNSEPLKDLYEKILDIYKEKDLYEPKNLIEAVAKSVDFIETPKKVEIRKIADILMRNLQSRLNSPLLDNYCLKSISEDGNHWTVDKGKGQKVTPENFYQENKLTSKELYWKFQTKNQGSYYNGCLGKIIANLLKNDKISSFVRYKDEKTGKIEDFDVIIPTFITVIAKNKLKNPMVFYQDNGQSARILRGSMRFFPFLMFPFDHTLLCLITNKVNNNGKRVFFLIDLTGPQFDHFAMTEKEYPYYEKKMITSMYEVDEDFFIPNSVRNLELEMKEFFEMTTMSQYYPKDIFEEVILASRNTVKSLLDTEKTQKNL